MNSKFEDTNFSLGYNKNQDGNRYSLFFYDLEKKEWGLTYSLVDVFYSADIIWDITFSEVINYWNTDLNVQILKDENKNIKVNQKVDLWENNKNTGESFLIWSWTVETIKETYESRVKNYIVSVTMNSNAKILELAKIKSDKDNSFFYIEDSKNSFELLEKLIYKANKTIYWTSPNNIIVSNDKLWDDWVYYWVVYWLKDEIKTKYSMKSLYEIANHNFIEWLKIILNDKLPLCFYVDNNKHIHVFSSDYTENKEEFNKKIVFTNWGNAKKINKEIDASNIINELMVRYEWDELEGKVMKRNEESIAKYGTRSEVIDNMWIVTKQQAELYAEKYLFHNSKPKEISSVEIWDFGLQNYTNGASWLTNIIPWFLFTISWVWDSRIGNFRDENEMVGKWYMIQRIDYTTTSTSIINDNTRTFYAQLSKFIENKEKKKTKWKVKKAKEWSSFGIKIKDFIQKKDGGIFKDTDIVDEFLVIDPEERIYEDIMIQYVPLSRKRIIEMNKLNEPINPTTKSTHSFWLLNFSSGLFDEWDKDRVHVILFEK